MNDISDTPAAGFVQDLGEAVRKNPISAALIGMGVLWLFTNGRTAERVAEVARRSGLDRLPDAVGEAYEAAQSQLRSGTDSIGSRTASAKDSLREGSVELIDGATRAGREYVDTATDYVSALPRSGAELLSNVRSNLMDVFSAQPLALGAIGIAIGAGIAAALPPTDVEASYLGEHSDGVKTKAAEFATQQTDRATKVVEAVMDAVSEESKRQGLTLDDARSAAGDISAKVNRVVNAAGKQVSEKFAEKSS